MQRYNVLAITFHWGVGLIIIGLLAVGLIMDDLPKPDKYVVYGWHKAFGIIVLALVTLRFAWRMKKVPPALPASIPHYQVVISKITHLALYCLMFAMPLVGWMMSSAGGHPVSVFGLPIPAIVEENKELGKLMHELHEWGAWALIALISLHIGAALYHQFIRKDGILLRMVPHNKS